MNPSTAGTRPSWVSRSAFEALAVESGEESEDEVVESTSPNSPPDRYTRLGIIFQQIKAHYCCISSSESQAKPSKSAIKKAKEVARLERQQQRKAARRQQGSPITDAPVKPPIEVRSDVKTSMPPAVRKENGAVPTQTVHAADTNGSATSPLATSNGPSERTFDALSKPAEANLGALPTPPPTLA